MPGNLHAASGAPGVGDHVVIHGRITIGNSGEMRSKLFDVLRAKPATVSIDLSDVSYIDTSGLATLVEAVRIARRHGTRLILLGIRDQPRYLFEITHLDRSFEIAGEEASR
ncbi:MAG: STAS domain-containing protein [Bryobacteraceae bacterium]